MKVKSESEVAQSYPTLNPMDCSLPGSSVHRIFQVRVLEWGAIAFSERTPSKITVMHVLGTLQLLGKARDCSHMISLFPEKGAHQDHA